MSATGPGTFRTDMRQVADTGKPVPYIGCECNKCGKVEWVSLASGKGPGAGSRIFKSKGWALGRRGAHKDLCPECQGKRKARDPGQDNRTPKQRRMAYLIASGVVDKGGGKKARVSVEKVPVNSIMAEVLAPVKKAIEAKQAEQAAAARQSPPRGHGNYASGGFTKRWNAARSARGFLASLDVPNAREGVHFRITEAPDGTFGYDLIEQPTLPEEPQPEREEILASDASTQAARDAAALAEPPRSPLPSDNKRILNAMDEHYDPEKRRYLKNFSDASVAMKLDVPPAWVKAVREQFDFGPDRNENTDAEVRAIREAYAEAQRTSTRLMEMAGEAETLANNLRARLTKMGVEA